MSRDNYFIKRYRKFRTASGREASPAPRRRRLSFWQKSNKESKHAGKTEVQQQQHREPKRLLRLAIRPKTFDSSASSQTSSDGQAPTKNGLYKRQQQSEAGQVPGLHPLPTFTAAPRQEVQPTPCIGSLSEAELASATATGCEAQPTATEAPLCEAQSASTTASSSDSQSAFTDAPRNKASSASTTSPRREACERYNSELKDKIANVKSTLFVLDEAIEESFQVTHALRARLFHTIASAGKADFANRKPKMLRLRTELRNHEHDLELLRSRQKSVSTSLTLLEELRPEELQPEELRPEELRP